MLFAALAIVAAVWQIAALRSSNEGGETNITSRIASSASEPGTAPYVIALHQRTTMVCTGSIIDAEWVLTAAHCIDDSRPANFHSVYAGATTVQDFSSASDSYNKTATVQKRVAKIIHNHPKYWSGKTGKYDVALIEVERFAFNDGINKVPLWGEEWVTPEKNSNHEYGIIECKAFGWGILEIGTPSEKARQADVTAHHGKRGCPCFPMFMQRRLICSGRSKTIGGLCFGDSGGPLVCNGLLAGVAHAIYAANRCKIFTGGDLKIMCNKQGIASAWMYVCPMLPFIKKHVPDAPEPPASCRSPRPSISVHARAACFIFMIAYVLR